MRLAVIAIASLITWPASAQPIPVTRECSIKLDGITRSGSACSVRPTDDRKIDFSFTVRSADIAINVSWVQPPYYVATIGVSEQISARNLIGRVDRIGNCWVGRRLEVCLGANQISPVGSEHVNEFELPRLNVNGWCDYFGQEMAQVDRRAKAICISREQLAYDTLKIWWPDVLDNVKALCIADAAHRLGGSAYRSGLTFAYEAMVTCVDTHMTRQSPPSFRP